MEFQLFVDQCVPTKYLHQTVKNITMVNYRNKLTCFL